MKNKSILVIDDDIEILTMIRTIFERDGFINVNICPSGIEALKILSCNIPDLVILDVMMPQIDGFTLLNEIRIISKVPVLMLTACGESHDKFKGFELGADDYIVKPFLSKELIFRVLAILKRVYPNESSKIFLANAIVDLSKAEIIKNNEHFTLTAKECAIFKKLYENDGRVVTIDSLCQTTCGDVWHGYEGTLMTHIRHLREKIEKNPSSPLSLITIKGLGYKLITKDVMS